MANYGLEKTPVDQKFSPFSDLKIGDFFILHNFISPLILQKISENKAVSERGSIHDFPTDRQVCRVSVRMVITEYARVEK